MITLLRDEELLSQERIELLLSWRHSGFSAHNAVTVPPGDDDGIERLGRYLLRSPLAVERMRFEEGMGCVRYRRKSLRGPGPFEKTFEASDFLARLLQHVPEPRLHQIRYYGHYSNVARARRTAVSPSVALPGPGESETTEPGAAERRRLRRSWARLIRRIFEVDPLVCTDCGGEMRIVSFILDPAVVRKILNHLGDSHLPPARAPPPGAVALS